MLIIISPAKTLDFETKSKISTYTIPDFLSKSETLIKELQKLSSKELSRLMKISPNLAQLNYERNMVWNVKFTTDNAKQALLAFTGEVFRGIDASGLSNQELEASQSYLRILSGLYGLLRPLDLILPYRLEMGTKLRNPKGNNLYKFWGNLLTERINETMTELDKKTLVNLASNEYYKAVNSKQIKARIITPAFKEEKNGEYKTIAVYAKKARGLMTRFIIQNQLSKPDDLKAFDVAGYAYDESMSNEKEFVFIR